MATKCVVLGAIPTNDAAPTPIEFTHYHSNNKEKWDYINGHISPSGWAYIELVCKNYKDGKDLMFVFDDADDRSDNSWLVLGYWNDGFVEN